MFKLKKKQTRSAKENVEENITETTKENKNHICKKENYLIKQIKLKPTQIVIGITTIAIVLFAFVLVLSSFLTQNSKKLNKENVVLNPELARAMTYDRIPDDADVVYEVDENGNITDTVIDNIKFLSFFAEKHGSSNTNLVKVNGTCNYGTNTDSLYIELKVLTDGYLKDGKIEIDGNNFLFKTNMLKDNIIGEDLIGECSTILLNPHINAGNQKIIRGIIERKSEPNINTYSQVNQVVFTGIFVDDEGNEHPIKKVIELTVDWYGDVQTEIDKNKTTQRKDKDELIKDKNIIVDFTLEARDLKDILLCKETGMTVELPKIKEFLPERVLVEGAPIVNYNKQTGVLRIKNTSSVNEEGYLDNGGISSRSYYKVTAIYPKELYNELDSDTLSLQIPVSAYIEGYNNPNDEFINPQRSETERVITVLYEKTPSGKLFDTEIEVGSYFNPETRMISKERPLAIYNNNRKSSSVDSYDVYWRVFLSDKANVEKILLEEPLQSDDTRNVDRFVGAGKTISMRDYERIERVIISYGEELLGKNGWIKIYDGDSGEEITTLKYGKYAYNFNYPVKSIKLETSPVVKSGSLIITQEKIIDDDAITSNMSLADFKKLAFIYSDFKATIYAPNGMKFDNGKTEFSINKTNYAFYEEPYSYAKLLTDLNTYKNKTSEEVSFTICASKENWTHAEWKNGIFLIRLPKEIFNIKVKNVEILSGNTEIENYITYKQDNNWFIKIVTKDASPSWGVSLKVNSLVTANPLLPTVTTNADLYYYNEECDNYDETVRDIYDIDNDATTYDNIGHKSIELHFIAPSGLVTAEYISDYDEEQSIAVAPIIAEINKTTESQLAKVNVSLTNNYNYVVSNMQIIGRTFYEGNKYLLAEKDLKSEYTAKMMSSIGIPQSVQNKATVYYSEEEDVTPTLENEANHWKSESEISNFENIKTYLITINDYKLTPNENLTFSYDIEIPGNLDYEKIAFGTHAVFFTVNFPEGKYKTSVEPTKVGIRTVKKYDFQLHKTKNTFANMPVANSIYSLDTHDDAYDNEDAFISKVVITNADGVAYFDNINIGREYILREIQTTSDYSINENIVRFKAEDINDELVFNILEGSFRDDVIIENIDGKMLVKSETEDEARYTLNINKKGKDGEIVSTARFIFKDGENEKIVYSGVAGVVQLDNLVVGKEYSIKEDSVKGYFLDNTERTFKVLRNDSGKLFIDTTDEFLSNFEVNEVDGTPKAIITTTIENEKIPTYNLEIIKVEEDVNVNDISKLKRLGNAKFTIQNLTEYDQEEYKTDENGLITVSGLYEVVEGKNDDTVYSIKETKEPLGYTPNEEEIKLKVSRNENNNLEVNIENLDNLTSVRKVVASEDKVTLYIQDKPLFKLSKVDKDTNEPLSGVKFAIYEITESGEIVDFAKDPNGNYVGLIDDNNEYYVITDENGTIALPLRKGIYKAVELNVPEGYEKSQKEEIFEVAGEQLVEESQESYDNVIPEEMKVEYEEKDGSEFEVIEINKIEDLVELSKRSQETELNKVKIVLNKSLDFNNDESYEDATRIDYGDINENGIVEPIKTELTTEKGFSPIANNSTITDFIFEGNNNKIENLYINRNDNTKVGFIGGSAVNGEFKNIEITGKIEGTISVGNTSIGGFVAESNSEIAFINCINGISVKATENVDKAYSNEYNSLGGFIGRTNGNSFFIDSENNGNFAVKQGHGVISVGGFAGFCTGEAKLLRVKNSGKIINTKVTTYNSYIGGLLGYSASSTFIECENAGLLETTSDETKESSNYIGGLVGYSVGFNKIDKCRSTGSLKIINGNNGNAYIGGYVGYGSSYIWLKELEYTTNIEATAMNVYCGGMIGYEKGSLIASKCEINGTFDLDENEKSIYWGGIVGYITDATEIYKTNIENGFEYDNTTNYLYAGGLVGYSTNNTKICNCINKKGNVTVDDFQDIYIGGLVGFVNGNNEFLQCENYSNMNFYVISQSGYANIGGIIGQSKGSLKAENCINEGNITNEGNLPDKYISKTLNVGGIVGDSGSCIISNCINKGNIKLTHGTSSGGGIVGKTTRLNITKCNNYGVIDVFSSASVYVGGIAGTGSGGIAQYCNNKGKILLKVTYTGGTDCIGGICGNGSGTTYKNCNNYEDLYADVHYTIWVGGIAGQGYDFENCNNYGEVYIESDGQGYPSIGGIAGGNVSYANNCNNYGDVTGVGGFNTAYFSGIAGGYSGVTVKYSKNSGKIKGTAESLNIGGISGGGNVYYCENTGDIEASNLGGYEIEAGGIIGNNGTAYYSYNSGNIYCTCESKSSYGRIYIGGISGGGYSYYSYNVGDVIANGKKTNVGAIVGYPSHSTTQSYYLDSITIKGDNINKSGKSASNIEMKAEDFISKIGGEQYWVYKEGEYPQVRYKNNVVSPLASTELVVGNRKKNYIVTTEVRNETGGSISGQNDLPYERIAYKNNNKKAILMVPDNNYFITDVSINNKAIPYTVESDGSLSLPEGYFMNVKENKHVVVTYGTEDSITTIQKVDSATGEKLNGAKFEIGKFNADRTDYFTYNWSNNYYFNNYVEGNRIEKYTSTNVGYGINESVANSTITATLPKEGDYKIVVNAKVSSETENDYGWATISREGMDTSNNTDGNFINISGEIEARDYESEVFTYDGENESEIFVVLGYTKNSSIDGGKDAFIINSVKLVNVNTLEEIDLTKDITRAGTYYFENVDGEYISTNGKYYQSSLYSNTSANSYMAGGLPNYGRYFLEYDVTITGDNSENYGYGTLSYGSHTTAESGENVYEFFKESGPITNKIYRTPIIDYNYDSPQYYVNLGYKKGECSLGDDSKMVINKITLYTIEDENFEITNNGERMISLPEGKYSIKEIEAPKGYSKQKESVEFEVVPGERKTITIENTKDTKVTVHHYLKQSDGTYTTLKVAEDEEYYGQEDETYSTLPHIDLEKLTLEKDESNKFIIPNNASGFFGTENQEVIYYYETNPVRLTVNHYSNNEMTKLAEEKVFIIDSMVSFNENGYTVTAEGKYEPSNNEEYIALLEKYNLVRVEVNNEEKNVESEVNYSIETEINYYYKIKQNEITTNVKEHEEIDDIGNTRIIKGGTISGEDEVPYEVVDYEQDSIKEIKIIPDEGYEIKEITINGEAIEFVPEEDGTYTLEKFTQVIENKHVEVEFQKKQGHVKVYHYVEGTTNPIELSDESLAPIEYKSGEFGTIYTTKPHEDITKYTVVTEDVENRQGTFIDDTIEVTYYYRLKDAEVTVNHYIVNADGTKTTNPVPLANGTVAESTILEGKVDDEYTTVAKQVGELDTNYELKETPSNAKGKMTVDPIEVNYYYGLKEAKVIVHHYQEPSETGGEVVKLAEDVTINGHVTDAYTTTQVSSEELPRKFELSRKSDNFEGNMTLEPIEVIYYYKTRDAVLNIKYEDYFTHEEISPSEQQAGKVDDDYITSEKNIDGWTYIESTGNETGKLDVDPITVIFYYKKQTKVTVNYIDKTTGEKLKENDGSESTEVKEGLEGEAYETIAKEFKWYVLTDPEPTNTEGQMTKDEIVVNYYYVRPETSLIEKHIDVTNNELLASETHEGRVGDEYNIASKEFEGYDLVEEKLPTNAEGRYTEEVQEVKYYYIKKARLIVKYIEKYTGEEIPNADGTPTGRDEENHHEGDSYTTEKKEFDGYELEEVPSNANGTLSGGTTEVIYYYKQIAGDVVENHIDKLTGLQLVEETIHEGYVGEDYETHEKDFANYDLVQEDYPTNATGKFRAEEQRVTYYYLQKSSVTIKYIDKETNKDIPNDDGTPSKEEKTGHVGDSYTSEAKPFNGYILEQVPSNKDGTMTEEPTTVIYYYRKIKFNLKIEKIIKSITVNGVEQQVNGDLAKAEVYRKEVQGQTIQVKYAIRVTNDSEVEGSARVIETVPSGMIMQASKNESWNVSGTTAILETEQILPGETKEYEVILDWNNGGDNIGTKTNTASIVSTENKYGVKETTEDDNEDEADLIIAVSTGDINYVFGAMGLLVILGAIAVTFVKLDDKKRKNS